MSKPRTHTVEEIHEMADLLAPLMTPCMVLALRVIRRHAIVEPHSVGFYAGKEATKNWNAQRTVDSLIRRGLVGEVEYELTETSQRKQAQRMDICRGFMLDRRMKGVVITWLGALVLYRCTGKFSGEA